MLDVTCKSSDGQDHVFSMDGNPQYCRFGNEIPIVVQPVQDPGWYFFNLLKGGLEFDRRFANDTVQLILPLITSKSRELFAKPLVCNFKRRPDAEFSFTNKEGKDLWLPSNIVFAKPFCSSRRVQKLINALMIIKNIANRSKVS